VKALPLPKAAEGKDKGELSKEPKVDADGQEMSPFLTLDFAEHGTMALYDEA
jgi:hypothetical protein